MKGLTTTTLLLVTVLATNCAAQCTIPSDAVGPVNGGLGSCTRGTVLSEYGNCEYCKCLYLFATSSVLLRCFTLTRSFLVLLSSIYQKTACNDEWTLTFDPAQTISESAGVTVTLGSVTGTLKTTLTGTDVTSAVVQVAKDDSFVKGSDTLTIGTTAAIANSAFTTKITARYTNRGNGYAGSPNRGYDTGSQRKTCKNQDGFACQSGETNCKLSPLNQDTTFDSSGDPCSYCSKCFKKSNGDSCTWQESIAEGKNADCMCGLAFTSTSGNVVKSAADVHCTVNGDSGCHCPASQAEFTSSYSFGSKLLVECKSGNLLQGGNDNWWGKTWGTIFQESDAAVTETSNSGSGATCEFFSSSSSCSSSSFIQTKAY